MNFKSLKYIDLFSGCGGLSLGLEKVGFNLELAVEKSDLAGRTFCYNFIDRRAQDDKWWKEYLTKSIESQFDSKLIISPVSDILLSKYIVDSLIGKEVDLIAGGPPCQGFSMAGKRQKSDPRNKLVWDFLDVVKTISPKFVLIENVLGINRPFAKGEPSSFSQIRAELYSLGYATQGFEVNAKNYGVPQNRPRMIILGIRKDIADNPNIANQLISSVVKDDDDTPTSIRPVKSNKSFVVKDAFDGLDNTGYGEPPSSEYALMAKGSNSGLFNHNVRRHSDKITRKFELLGWFFENNKSPKILREIALGSSSISDFSGSVAYPIKLSNGKVLALDVSAFEILIGESLSKKQVQRVLDLNKIAPTVMSNSDDCIHPLYYRGLTVREMARLQSFPDEFIFLGKETTGGKLRKIEVPQYTQVGNAVPPLLGEALGLMIQSLTV